MAEKINHWCIICGKGYHACDSCLKIESFTPWRTVTDTIEHFQIYMIIKDYKGGLINKETARQELENTGVSLKDVGTFKTDVNKVLDEILKEDKPQKTSRKNIKSAEIEMDTDSISDEIAVDKSHKEESKQDLDL